MGKEQKTNIPANAHIFSRDYTLAGTHPLPVRDRPGVKSIIPSSVDRGINA
ncbi:MAG: hypothetical protein HPY66_0351 [Firmicutes bacterium]|nr:hypothetical protein [Bacillota bacterium]